MYACISVSIPVSRFAGADRYSWDQIFKEEVWLNNIHEYAAE